MKQFRFFFAMSVLALSFTACSNVTVTRENDFQIKKKQTYKTVDGISLVGDLYEPKISGRKPAVLVVHGGSWAGRAGDMHEICDDLAGSGFVVFNIGYRFAPVYLYPKAVDDVRDAVQFLRAHADEFEIDPDQISAWGYSAGSHLILMAGLDPKLHLRAMVAGGTPADFSMWPDSPVIHKFMGMTYAEGKSAWDAASPVNNVSPESPPVFLYHGQNDHLVEVEQMERMKIALEKKGVEVKTYEVPLFGHIFVYLFSVQSIKSGIEFLKAHMGPPKTSIGSAKPLTVRVPKDLN